MTKIITTLTLLILSTIGSLSAQSVMGHWAGTLEIPGMPLPVHFHISEENDQLITTMDSPEQSAMGIPTTQTTLDADQLTITMDAMKMTYRGTVNGDRITGTYYQQGKEAPLNLLRSTAEATAAKKRPQDPEGPFSYDVEQVTFKNSNANNIQLAGTLTLPRNVENPPVAIMISGSGPQNRDSELFNHRPFLVWADHLTTNGIAVLRYDDRGVGQSEGDHPTATSADFATDVEAAVAYLKTRTDINTEQIGLIGHSEGGFIAPMVASKDKSIAFLVLLAGTGVDGKQILITQTRRSQEVAGAPKDIVAANEQLMEKILDLALLEDDPSKVKTNITQYLTSFRENNPDSPLASALTKETIAAQAATFSTPWILYFIKTDPTQFLSKVTSPVLAINGSKDYQVLPELNLPAIETSLKTAGNQDVTVKEIANLNHLFQHSETGGGDEYEKIDETIAPEVLDLVTNWIFKQF